LRAKARAREKERARARARGRENKRGRGRAKSQDEGKEEGEEESEAEGEDETEGVDRKRTEGGHRGRTRGAVTDMIVVQLTGQPGSLPLPLPFFLYLVEQQRLSSTNIADGPLMLDCSVLSAKKTGRDAMRKSEFGLKVSDPKIKEMRGQR
jgi:hypothetical protein